MELHEQRVRVRARVGRSTSRKRRVHTRLGPDPFYDWLMERNQKLANAALSALRRRGAA